MAKPQCRGTTTDGRRCQNRGRCPHHSGSQPRAAKAGGLSPLLVVGGYDVYDPRAARSRVKDTTPRPRWQAPPWAGTDADQARAQIDQLHCDSAELCAAHEQGWGEFFRTLFRRKR